MTSVVDAALFKKKKQVKGYVLRSLVPALTLQQ